MLVTLFATGLLGNRAVIALSVSLPLYAGVAPVGAMTGVRAMVWKGSVPTGAPFYESTTEQVEPNSVITLDLTGADPGLSAGDDVFVQLLKVDGVDHRASLVFAGKLTVVAT